MNKKENFCKSGRAGLVHSTALSMDEAGHKRSTTSHSRA
jgi:hypothetical protein